MTPSCAFYRNRQWYWGYAPAQRLRLPRMQLHQLPELLAQHQATIAVGVIPYDAGIEDTRLDKEQTEPDTHIELLLFDQLESGTTLPTPCGHFALDANFVAQQTAADYQAAFARIQQYLLAGDCYQVNYAQAFSTTFTGSPYTAWWRLMQHHAAPHSCYFEGRDSTLLSASPERFIAVGDGMIQSEPIKGSCPRGDTPDKDAALGHQLQNSEKDLAENLMIVDLLRNDLGKISEAGSITAAPLFELHKFSNVQHLISRISGQLRHDVSPIDALLACFPGGSITGAPKRRSMQIIEELEPQARHAYCGSFFTLDNQARLDSNILIRTFQAQHNRLTIHGGGAITIASDCDAEYRESLFKIDQLMQALTTPATSPKECVGAP